MKKGLFIIFLLTTGLVLNAQNYQTGRRVINFADISRSRTVTTDLYYPANTGGDNVAIVTGTDKFPVVVFGHGFVIPINSYKWLVDSLVKRGYIVSLPSTESGFSPSHLAFGLDIAFLAARITSLNDSVQSFLSGRVIKKAAVAGHSMGGGASFIASATQDPAIAAIFNFAAAETNPSATVAASSTIVPALIFSGSGDCIVPPNVQTAMYNNVQAACKTYVNITNALHCQFSNNNFTCSFGESSSGCNTTSLTIPVLFDKITSLLLPFLDYNLKGICTRGLDFINVYNNLSGVVKQQSCSPLPDCGVVPVRLLNFTARMKKKYLELYWNTTVEENLSYYQIERSSDGIEFFSLQKVLPKGRNGSDASYSAIDTYPFSGISYYKLRMVDKDGRFVHSPTLKIETVEKSVAVSRLFPNPAKDYLNVQLKSDRLQDVIITANDGLAAMIFVRSYKLNKGFNNIQLFTGNYQRGYYVFKINDERGVELDQFRILKN